MIFKLYDCLQNSDVIETSTSIRARLVYVGHTYLFMYHSLFPVLVCYQVIFTYPRDTYPFSEIYMFYVHIHARSTYQYFLPLYEMLTTFPFIAIYNFSFQYLLNICINCILDFKKSCIEKAYVLDGFEPHAVHLLSEESMDNTVNSKLLVSTHTHTHHTHTHSHNHFIFVIFNTSNIVQYMYYVLPPSKIPPLMALILINNRN